MIGRGDVMRGEGRRGEDRIGEEGRGDDDKLETFRKLRNTENVMILGPNEAK